jgi:hypothetical protein
MPAHRTVLLAVLAVALALPSAAVAANSVSQRSWGGIEFSDSDRDTESSGDTYAIGADRDTGGILSVGRAGSSQYAHRFGPDGRETQRFKLRKSVTGIVGPGDGVVFTGTSAGKVDRYSKAGKLVSEFSAGGPVTALTDGPGGLVVATADAITNYSLSGQKRVTFPIAQTKSLEIGPEGRMYVADGTTAKVYDSSGTLIRTLAGVEAPDQIGVDGSGRAYVHDSSQEGFGLKVFADDGAFLGIATSGFYDLQSQAKESVGGPILLSVSANGDVYFVPQNPDILRIPAKVVPAPRFRVDDPSRAVPQFYDTDPIAVSVGKAATFTTNVFRSLSSGLSIGLAAPAALELAAGTPRKTPVSIPAGKDFTGIDWTFSVRAPGRVPVRLTARGTGPGGEATSSSKTLPVYGIDGPNITIQGAATRRGAKYALVAILVDIGKTKIAKADRADLLQYLSDSFQVESTARIGGKPVEELGFEIGESLTGMCVPFPAKGTPKIAVTARIPATGRFKGATAKRTVTPTSRPRTALMKDCYKAIDLAGL